MAEEAAVKAEDTWEVASPEQVTDAETLRIEIKRPLLVDGTKFSYVELRYPNRKDMKRTKNAKGLSDDERSEKLLLSLCISPALTPDVLDTMAQSDFMYIQDKLQKSGFFGVTEKAT